MNIDRMDMKDIMANIMLSLMKIEGNLSELVQLQTPVHYMNGGEIDELTTDKE